MVLIFSTPSRSASASKPVKMRLSLSTRRSGVMRDAVWVKPTRSANRIDTSAKPSAIVVSPALRRRTIGIGQDVAQQRLGAIALHLQLRQIVLLALAPALALEAGVDAGAQQHEVERLRQVILGAHLDAADHRLGLAEARDHDHRDAVEPLVGLQPLEHLDAVHLRHHADRGGSGRSSPRREWRAPCGRIPP